MTREWNSLFYASWRSEIVAHQNLGNVVVRLTFSIQDLHETPAAKRVNSQKRRSNIEYHVQHALKVLPCHQMKCCRNVTSSKSLAQNRNGNFKFLIIEQWPWWDAVHRERFVVPYTSHRRLHNESLKSYVFHDHTSFTPLEFSQVLWAQPNYIFSRRRNTGSHEKPTTRHNSRLSIFSQSAEVRLRLVRLVFSSAQNTTQLTKCQMLRIWRSVCQSHSQIFGRVEATARRVPVLTQSVSLP